MPTADEMGRMGQHKIRQGFLADVQAQWPALPLETQEAIAYDMYRRHMRDLGRRPKLKRRQRVRP
jgi:hypothetical protein